mgnify:CR=1 FL=1|jgi:hypothetical protein
MYSCYTFAKETRKDLLKRFRPLYTDVIADHITYEFGSKELPPYAAEVFVYGHLTDNIGIEALMVEVNGSLFRPDNQLYHITWSLERAKGYKPKHTNLIIQGYPINKFEAFEIEVYTEVR